MNKELEVLEYLKHNTPAIGVSVIIKRIGITRGEWEHARRSLMRRGFIEKIHVGRLTTYYVNLDRLDEIEKFMDERAKLRDALKGE